MSGREKMPMRRGLVRVETYFEPADYTIDYSGDDAGRVLEVFITTRKAGTPIESAARDAAIAISHALQRGAALDELRASMTRDGQGAPLSIAGHALDMIAADLGSAA